MRILITGICGFVGSSVAASLLERRENVSITGVDNLIRPGSDGNRRRLAKLGISVVHGDVRAASDFEPLPAAEWVIDAAANPSVLAGLNGNCTSRQLFEHNVSSLVNVLEYSRRNGAGLVLLSSSRIYSVRALTDLPLKDCGSSFELDETRSLPTGVSSKGIGVNFSVQPPVSLYGSTKLASEALALEWGTAFNFPVWINRCGVLAGAGQFGTPDQGIVSYWINAHLRKRALSFIGFDGKGKQVRDVLHPRDLTALLDSQMRSARSEGQRVYTAGGGRANSISLAQLSAWCDTRFEPHRPKSNPATRPYDVPWVVMDNGDVERDFRWTVQTPIREVLEEIAAHAERNPDWLERSGL